MYNEYFGFKEDPFSIAPDPQFLYMSEKHREALAHLIYGMKADSGFVLLTGEVGTGKTTVCRCLLNQIPDHSEVAFILNPKLSVVELLATICDELGIEYPFGTASIKVFVDRLNLFLLDAYSRNKRTILIIDEAQNLSVDVLEQIRLLTNLETDKRKLLQVILLGQPELNQLLERPELRQLAQRVTARYHLEPLLLHNISAYLGYRLAKAGVERPLFTPSAIKKLYRLSGGVPRLINLISDRALLGAYALGEHQVGPKVVAQAAREIFGAEHRHQTTGKWFFSVVLLLFVIVAVVVAMFLFLPASQRQEKVALVLLAPELTDLTEAQGSDADLLSPASQLPPEQPEAVLTIAAPSQLTADQSRSQAMRSLLALWGYTDSSDQTTSIIPPADVNGLALQEEEGGLTLLRTFNHPAILSLTDAYGNDGFYALLTALDAANATLVVGMDLLRVPVATLLDQWDGRFTLLWEPPPGYDGVLRYGDEGIIVFWLEQQLAELTGREPRAVRDLRFDDQLMDDVRRFQRRSGLVPDGLVGPNTLIAMNARMTTDQPRLANHREQ
jgi:general secretion pathway protein A